MKMEFQKIEVPKELDQVVADSMDRIYTEQRRKKIRNRIAGLGSAAAIFTGGVLVCVTNPALAANIPVIGHIFERLQDDYGYQGNFDDVKETLIDEQTADGLTVALSEIYCNDQALYLTMQLTSEEPFPEIDSGFQMEGNARYSFNPTEQWAYSRLEGEFEDDHTFVGIIRQDLNEVTLDTSEYDAEREKALAAGEKWNDAVGVGIENENWDKFTKTVEIPDQFSVQFDFTDIYSWLKNPDPRPDWPSEEEFEAMSDEEWHDFMITWDKEHPDWATEPNEHTYVIYNGHWKFDLDVTKNTSDTQVIELNDINDLGVGIEKVVKDRFEITMYPAFADKDQWADYFEVMLDADGRLMPYGGDGSTDTVAIQDRDVSHVDIFLVDYYLWMDDLKGNYWSGTEPTPEELQNYRNTLLEKCAYHTEVEFE